MHCLIPLFALIILLIAQGGYAAPLPPVKPTVFSASSPVVSSGPEIDSTLPVPREKPASVENSDNRRSFDSVLTRVLDVAEDRAQAVITPPPLPEMKQIAPPVEARIVGGIPVPGEKPLRVIARFEVSTDSGSLTARQPVTQPDTVVIPYRGDNMDDRTAGANRPSPPRLNETERIYAEKIGRLREARMPSPFPEDDLPRPADARNGMGEPVILFFKEGTPELEVGQMTVLRSDVLTPMNRSRSVRAVIYGYAEPNRRDGDEARRLSLSRALMVREFLVDHRVAPERIDVRAMESDTPIAPKDRVDIVLTR